MSKCLKGKGSWKGCAITQHDTAITADVIQLDCHTLREPRPSPYYHLVGVWKFLKMCFGNMLAGGYQLPAFCWRFMYFLSTIPYKQNELFRWGLHCQCRNVRNSRPLKGLSHISHVSASCQFNLRLAPSQCDTVDKPGLLKSIPRLLQLN